MLDYIVYLTYCKHTTGNSHLKIVKHQSRSYPEIKNPKSKLYNYTRVVLDYIIHHTIHPKVSLQLANV
jgi:hypothetical protein